MMNSKYITLKVANMRKEQQFIVYPNGTSREYIILQSDKRIARLNKTTGELQITKKNYNYPMFAMLAIDNVTVQLDNAKIEEIKREYNAMSNGQNGIVQVL
jgi:hypothetical protein